MRILLPPSEAKSSGGRRRRLAERPAATDPLSRARDTVLAALVKLVAGDRTAAAKALLLPPAVIDDAIASNAQVLTSPTTSALQRYAGVVYAGLAADTLDAASRRVAERSTLVFSGLFGVVRGDEPVPAYRVPAKAQLPGLGILSTFWRPVLDQVVPELLGRHLVVDLRSTDYQAMWRPQPTSTRPLVSVRVLSTRPGAAPAVISYPSKFGKGVLARSLVEREARGQRITTVDDVVAAWLASGGAGAEARAGHGLDLLL